MHFLVRKCSHAKDQDITLVGENLGTHQNQQAAVVPEFIGEASQSVAIMVGDTYPVQTFAPGFKSNLVQADDAVGGMSFFMDMDVYNHC